MAATPLRSSHTLSSSPLLSPSAIIATLPAKAPKTPAIPRADSLNRSTSIWDVPESDEDPVLEELPKKQEEEAVKATTTEKKPRARKKDATLSVATNKDVRDGVKSKYFSGGVAEALEALGESLDIIPPAETAEPKPKTVRKRAPKKTTGDATAAPKPSRKKAEPKAKAAPKTKAKSKEKEAGNKEGNEAEATTGLEPIAEDTPTVPLPSPPRRREWTPVLDTLPEPTETPLHTDADNVPPTDTPITSFGNKIGALRFSTSVSDSTSMPTELRPLVLKKRPIEMVELPNPRPPPAEPAPKPKKTRKKPQTLTERASAQYRQEPGSPQPITQFFATSKKTSVSGKEKAATSTAGATKKRKNEEETTLVSPNTARQRLDRQEFVFGTLSQLEKQTVEDEEVLSPPQIQQEAEPVPGGTINRVVTASGGLWDAAGYRDPVNAINDAPAAENLENTCAAEHPQREPTPTLPDAPPVNPHPKPSDKPKPAVSKRYSVVDLTLSSSPAAKPALSKPKNPSEPPTWTIPSSSPKQLPRLQSSPIIAAAVTSFSSPCGWNIPPPIFSSQPSAKRAFTTTASPEARRAKSSSPSGDQSFEAPPPSSPPPQIASKLVEPGEETAVAVVTPKRRNRVQKLVLEAVEGEAVASDTPAPKPRSRSQSRKLVPEEDAVADTPVPKPRSRSRKVAVEVVDVLEAPVAPVAPLTSDSVEQLPMSPSPSKRRTRSPSETPVAKRRSVSRAATPMEAASVLDAEPTKLVSIPNIEKQKAEVLVDSEPVPAKKPRSRTKKAVMSEEPVTTPKASGLPDKNALDTELVPVVEIPASPEPEIIVSPRKRRSVSPSESSPAKRKAKSRAKTPVETTEPEMVAERLSTPDIDDYLPKRAASVQPVVTKETTLDIDDLLPQSKKTRKPRSASALPGSASKKATTPDIDDILQSVKKPAVRKSRAKVPSGSPSRTRTPSRTRSRSRSIVSETEVETATKTKAKRTPRVRKSRSRSVIPETDHEDNALSSPETTRKRTRRKSRSKSPKRSPRKKTVKRTPKLKPLAKELEEDLFKRIGAEVKKDKTPGGWFERILMYDPIVVEELVDWLKERGVVRVLGGEVEEPEAPKKKGRGKAKAKDIEPEVEEPVKEPVAPIDEDVKSMVLLRWRVLCRHFDERWQD
ncbi:hypothetical protein BZA77DRAFT_391394 [Pyronema omphalodes]|nr:hypothetical protein BZA77DRAFT_391394 [Pyronema omphalodes]